MFLIFKFTHIASYQYLKNHLNQYYVYMIGQNRQRLPGIFLCFRRDRNLFPSNPAQANTTQRIDI